MRTLAPAWVIRSGAWDMAPGILRHRPTAADGRPAPSALGALQCELPGRGAREIVFSVKFSSTAPRAISLAFDDVKFEFATRWRNPAGQAKPLRNFSLVEINFESLLLEGFSENVAAYADCRAVPGKTHELKAIGNPAEAAFFVDGREIFRHARLRGRPYRSVFLATWCPAEFSNVRLEVDGIEPAPARPKPKKKLTLSTSFDGGAIRHQVFLTPPMLTTVFRELKRLGFDRVYYIDYGSPAREFWTDPEMIRLHRERYGQVPGYRWMRYEGDWLKLVAGLAHAEGLEFYTKFKVMDLHLWSENPRENFTDLEQVQYQHREKKMQRRPLPPGFAPANAPVGAIRFIKDDNLASPVRVEELQLWVSDDNLRYRPYTGPLRRRESVEERAFLRWWEETRAPPGRVRILHLEGLQITEPFFAVTVPAHRTDCLFRNQLHRLVEMESADGQPFPFTFCLHPDAQPTPGAGPADFPWHGEKIWRGGLREGIYWGGIPTGTIPAVDGMERLWALDNVCRVTGFKRGTVEFAGSVFCPAYDEVHDFWLSRIRGAYEAGADGVDIRIRNHNKCLEWARMGFNPPVVAEYRRRYGADITREPVDHIKHQQLLGEFYLGFLRKARALSRQYRRVLQHHVSISMDVTPAQMGMVGIYWDWRTWLKEGLADEITLKEIFPGHPFFDEVTDLARASRIRMHFCPFMNSVLAREPNYDEIIGGHMARALEEGLDGYWLHEVYCLLKRDVVNDKVEFTHPKLENAIRRARK